MYIIPYSKLISFWIYNQSTNLNYINIWRYIYRDISMTSFYSDCRFVIKSHHLWFTRSLINNRFICLMICTFSIIKWFSSPHSFRLFRRQCYIKSVTDSIVMNLIGRTRLYLNRIEIEILICTHTMLLNIVKLSWLEWKLEKCNYL